MAAVTWRRAAEAGIETGGQIWVMVHLGLAAGGGDRCKDDGRFPMGPWSEMGKPEGGQVGGAKDLILDVLTRQPRLASNWRCQAGGWLEDSGV